MIEINFSPADLDEVQRVADIRHLPKVEAGIKDNCYATHKMTPAQSHFNGLLGEFAAAYYIGGEVDKTYNPKGDKGRPDFYVNGLGIEVKYTNLFRGDFIVPNRVIDPLNFRADIGIVCHPGYNTRRVILAAWVTREIFLSDYHIRNYGDGDRTAITQSNMRFMSELMDFIYGERSSMVER